MDDGALEGNPADMPAPRKFADGQAWQIGKPDMIITLPKDVLVKAHGPDWWPDILVDPGLTEDRYVQGDPDYSHQGLSTSSTTSGLPSSKPDADTRHSGQLDGNVRLEVGEQGVFLNEYAIGKGADVFTEGSGRLIKAGTKINFQFHLHASGTETPINVALGLEVLSQGLRAQARRSLRSPWA